MFVAMLEQEQRRVLLRAAATLAERDGARPDAEDELLDALNVEAGLSEVPPVPDSDEELFAEATEAFGGDQTARNILLLELAGVALIDGGAQPEEIAFLASLAERLGADEAVLARALELGERAKALLDDGRAFIISDVS
jgi:hypothetical protein